MDTDEINYKTLRRIQQIERNAPMLTKVDDGFYRALSQYVNGLEGRLKKESPSQKQMLLKEEIQNTRKITTNIYEQREKKILLAAISKARGGNPDLKHLIDKEQQLFDSVLELMTQSRKQLLNKESEQIKKEEIKPVEPKNEEKENETQENTNPVVQITQDIPEFIGTDTKHYHLKKNDIISLPGDMSDTLAERDAARKIKQQ